MLTKLKSKLKQWLLSDEIEQLKSLQEQIINLNDLSDSLFHKFNCSLENLSEARNYYHDAEGLAKSVHRLMTEMLNVSIDVHLKEPHSWAIISIKGKPEYIKFINLGNDHKTARDIMMWLKQFEGSNITTDSPFTSYFMEELKNNKRKR